MTISDYAFHDAANIFPMDDEHLEELAADIKANGQQVAIELFDAKILDGRRRFMACRIAGVKPTFRNVNPDDPVAYVLSLNLHRRHLSPTQLSMIGARVRKMYDDAAKERQSKTLKKGTENPDMENFPERGTCSKPSTTSDAQSSSGLKPKR